MSTFYEHNYEGKRPSQAMILKKVNEAIKQGAIDIHLNWGENWLRFEYCNAWNGRRQWHGYGWFRTVCGDNIAKLLNEGKA